MILAPMLADFAVRLAFGLSIADGAHFVAGGSARRFFRTQEQIILGLLALAALDQARAERGGDFILDHRRGGECWLTCHRSPGGWGCRAWVQETAGLARALATLAGLTARRSAGQGLSGLFPHRRAGWLPGFLLGSVLCSMLLGHYYLTAPAMTIEPLEATRSP